MKLISRVVIGAGLFVSLNLLHAAPLQVSAQPVQSLGVVSAAPPDSIVQATAQAQGLALVATADLPAVGGTFWLVTTNGIAAPSPCPPDNLSDFPVYQMADGIFLVDETGGQVATNADNSGTTESALSAEADAVVNLINQVQNAQAAQLSSGTALAVGRGAGMAMMMSDFSSMTTPTYDTNGLWLEMTNIANGWSYFNLHNSTNFVYAILSTTSLAGGTWNVETELFPTGDQTNVMPFAVQNLDRQNLFLKAMDWTGVTENGNTVPDWWLWEYFGTTALSDTNLDSQGNTLVYDYINGFDPNVIYFSFSLGSQIFNSPFATGQFVVSAGTPSYETVLVNDTNLNDAVWAPYNGNILMNLGSTDGVYQVTMGLKGRAPNSTPTWMGTEVSLAQAAPALVITNPVSNVLALSYIQLQGYAAKPLASINYDLNNANGVVTGQPGYVTGELFDTNSLTVTTNSFQCFDVPLADGTNTITLHATDVAGNVSTLTTNFIVDYSGKTNPPTIQLDWPQDGMQIASGNNITVSGTLDDPTASVSLQVTDDVGDTNTFAGVVERDGHFWIQNVPMAGTEDVLTLTVQDDASNTATMNLTVTEDEDSELTINPVTSDLWDSSATVGGTIADDSYAVTVNGILATNNGDGTWTAYGVPINDGNMAVFNAVATSAGTDEMLAGRGSMAAFTTMSSSSSVNLQMTTIKPAALKLAAVWYSDVSQDNAGIDGTNIETWSLVWNWVAKQGGTYLDSLQSTAGEGYSQQYAGTILADRSLPYLNFTDTDGYNYVISNAQTGAWQSDMPQTVGAETAINPLSGFFWENMQGTASWVLHAGGLSVAGSAALFALTAQATTETPVYYYLRGIFINGTNLAPQEITDIGQPLDASSLAYESFPVGATVKAPIQTDQPLVQENGQETKHTPVISWKYGPAITNTQNVIVGQAINLTCDWDTSGGPAITNYSWTVPGITFSNYVANDSSGILYTDFLKNTNEVDYYWINSGSDQVSCEVTAGGQTITAQATFNVKRPLAEIVAIGGTVALDQFYAFPYNHYRLHCGVPTDGYTGMSYSNTIIMPPGYTGQTNVEWVQKVTLLGRVHANGVWYQKNVNVTPQALDTAYPYNVVANIQEATDSPASQILDGFDGVSYSEDFTMWLMFKPDNNTAQWVPLGKVSWHWDGAGNAITNYFGKQWVLTSTNNPGNPTNTISFDHPQWNWNETNTSVFTWQRQ